MPIVAMNPMELQEEAKRLHELLRAKTVKVVLRHRPSELVIAFDDGTTLFIESAPDGLEFSVTG